MLTLEFKAIVVRLYPTNEQIEYFSKCFGCVRFIYNQMLNDKIEHYKTTKTMLYTTPAKYKKDYPFLKEVDSLALANAQLNLESAYSNFFSKRGGFPKFKAKRKCRDSYTTNKVVDKKTGKTNIKITSNSIKLPKLKTEVKAKIHTTIPSIEKVKSITISKTKSGKYYASIKVIVDDKPKSAVIDESTTIGLDYSSKSLYVDSNNCNADFPKFYRRAEKKLAKMQRQLSKKQQGSKNYEKARLRLAKQHEHVANQRTDYLHKESLRLATTYKCVCIESLNMRAISQTLRLGKSTLDNGWGKFTDMLAYKLTDRGGTLVKVPKNYASSKICNHCQSKNKDLKLSDRICTCPTCGALIERDYNAALNIKDEGLRMLGLK